MNDIISIIKKEFHGVFKDKVIIFQVFLLPFIVVFGYMLLMSVVSDMGGETDKDTLAYSINTPQIMQEAFDSLGIESKTEGDVEALKKDMEKGKCNLIIQFPKDFNINVSATEAPSNIEMWYNSSETYSLDIYTKTKDMLSMYQPVAFTINADTRNTYDLGDPDKSFKKLLASIIPIIMFMSIFTSCMNIAAETIAGDKERGFLNTILITPVPRGNIAIGKAVFIFSIGTVGGISSFVGLVLGLPKFAEQMNMGDSSIYTFSDYLLLFFVSMTAVFALSGILLIVSTFAKSVKQATTIAPVFLLIISILGMLRSVETIEAAIEKIGIGNSVIPVWNSLDCLQEILSDELSVLKVIISCVVNISFAIVSLVVISKLFEKENIVNNQ